MNAISTKAVVILGTGATIGSGFTHCRQQLPGDRGFFGHPVVMEQVRNYPALDIMLDIFRETHGQDLDSLGLEEAWTYLEFSSIDVYKQLSNLNKECEEWLQRIRRNEARSNDEHCLCRWYRDNQTIPLPMDIDLNLIAGWDLRRLLSKIYGEISPPSQHNVYQALLEKYKIPQDSTTTFVSLNYDLVLEHALTDAGIPWHYLHIYTTTEHDRNSIQIIKPHGSLNWLFKGNVPTVHISTDYRLTPVKHRSDEVNQFEEAMLVPPTQLKQQVNLTRSTQAEPTRVLILKLWKSMAEALKEVSRVFIIGYSFPSTDHHLRTLFYQVNRERGFRQYEEVHCCTRADGCHERVAKRFFPARNFHFHDRGFEDFVSKDSNSVL